MSNHRKKENVSTLAPPLVVTTAEAARMLGLRAQTLRMMRVTGRGPTFCRVSNNRVVYTTADLLAFIEARKATSTADARVRLGVA